MGEKFIIELEDEVNGLRKAKGFNTLVFDQNGVNKLTPYKEKKETSTARWKPENNTMYWYMYNGGAIACVPWYDDEADHDFFAIGNCFRTKEDAKFAVERLKVIAELKEYAETKERSNTAGVQHWHLAYDLSTREVVGTFSFSMLNGDIFFENEKTLQKAIDAVGKERIKKYYLGVE
jgi:hypothetical protein